MSLGGEYQVDLEIAHAVREEVAYRLREKMECPECYSKLREVEGKYGLFLGCTDFPKCKFSISLE